jgi:hypothetical protein
VPFLRIVPMAFVMVAGPQIISAVVFATSERARANSVAYVAGAVSSIIVGTTLSFILWEALGFKSGTLSGGHVYVEWTLVALLAVLAVRVFLGRAESEPPKWMGKLETASPRFAFRLGLLLFIAMPTDILTMLAVSGYLSTHNESLLQAIPFILLTALLVGFPLLVLLAMGHRAETTLPKVRDWMNTNSWVVSEIVIVFFLILELKDALAS